MPTRPEARAIDGSCWPCGLKSRSSVFFCRYLSVKSLPEALRMEEEEDEETEGQDHTLGFDRLAPAPAKAVASRLPTRQPPVQAERSHGVLLE